MRRLSLKRQLALVLIHESRIQEIEMVLLRMSIKLTIPCLIVLIGSGCGGGDKETGPTGDVKGTVTLNGKPLTEGSIAFEDHETGISGGAKLDSSGAFTLEDPLPVGNYKVSILPPDPPQPDDEAAGKLAAKSAIHPGYQDPTTSGFTEEVKEGENSFKFDLEKNGPPRNTGDGMPP